MKQIRWVMAIVTVLMLTGAILIVVKLRPNKGVENREYLVEVNRIYEEIQTYCKTHEGNVTIENLALEDFLSGRGYSSVKNLSYFNEGHENIQTFFEGKGADATLYSYFLPLTIEDTGGPRFVRFEYVKKEKEYSTLKYVLIGITASMWLLAMIVLAYLKHNILRPFYQIEQLPYELAKGHLSIELKENKYRYFGKFLWGLDALRETLKKNQTRQLQLEKEKKMLILSVSHDIKTPLSSIYLYNKALKEGLYEEDKKLEIYHKLQQKAEQIEDFVAEIEKMSTENLLEMSVCVRDCYVSEFMEPIKEIYKEKFAIYHTSFESKPYPNKMVKADRDRIMEVLENILENAIKYGDGKRISISFTEEEYCLLITITNSGVPIEEKEFPHMFDSFWRGANAKEQRGSGLGLYICKELMAKMEGDIYATRKNDGMSFTLVLREI